MAERRASGFRGESIDVGRLGGVWLYSLFTVEGRLGKISCGVERSGLFFVECWGIFVEGVIVLVVEVVK